MSRVLRDGTALTVERFPPPVPPGRGPVVLLHGGGQTRHSWRTTATWMSADGWDVVTVDLRGHGDSDWARDGDYSLTALADDLARVLDEHGSPAVLCGASMGGTAALALQQRAPALTRALVLVDIAPRVEPAGARRILAFMGATPDGFADLDEAAAAVSAYDGLRPAPASPEGLRRNLRRREDGRWRWHWDPAFIEPRRHAAGRDADARQALAAAACTVAPTLLVRGTVSDVVGDAGAAELLDLVPHAETVQVAGAGHMVVGHDNDAFGRALAGFLDRVTAPETGAPPRPG